MSVRSTVLALSLFAAPALVAQVPIVLRGEVTDGSAAGCYYCPGFSHVIKFSGTALASTTIDLTPYHNQYCKLTGTWNGAVVEVSAVEVVAESFSISGNAHIGTTIDFTAHGTNGDFAANALSLGTACGVPFADCGVLLNGSSLSMLGLGVLDNNGEYECSVDIPDAPALVGLRVFGQALMLPLNGPIWMTNLDAKEIS